MQLVPGMVTIVADGTTSPVAGRVRWAPVKSVWIGSMTATTLLVGPFVATWDALALFLVTTGITLCFGHSVGMHRRLIHRSFACPLWLEHGLVYLGTLVGMAGPLGMMRQHDMRDWAQRQPDCHAYFCHRRSFWRDAWWQLHCELVLDHPPRFAPPPEVAKDAVYRRMERTWMAQQLPWAILFFALGGWSWVVWGTAARVAVSVTGHWLVGHYAHRQGPQSFLIEGAAAQGYNVAIAGLISMGESWHNNHHAYPGSAKLGLFPGQADPGFWLIKGFEAVGLAWDIRLPEHLPHRLQLLHLNRDGGGCPALRRLEHWAAARDTRARRPRQSAA
ncbi:MAG: acyl-CoA desaturase [Alphaproteobacteria bacterium]|nr:acyl-CoA desaturase [Alphaproteobacteria bacterium]